MGLEDRVKCQCFDTTSSNTGHMNGACVLLEQKLGHQMLHFACRHHVHEIVLEAVTVTCLGPSTGPDIALFKRFQGQWQFIDQEKFEILTVDENEQEFVSVDDTILFAKEQLKKYQPRDDYKELLELSIIALGGVPERGIRFRLPGALHRARWMAKAIYGTKIFLFRKQFKLTKREEKGMRNLTVFVIGIYIKHWFTAPSAVRAPANDLEFLKKLESYKIVNEEISRIAVKKFSRHLWYLSEELIPLALFDDKVSAETKARISAAITQGDGAELDHYPSKRTTVLVHDIPRRELWDFPTQNSQRFFVFLELPMAFLNDDPVTWHQSESYNAALAIVSKLKAVNDNAERGVAPMTEYNEILTSNEDQKQYLLQVVSEHRRKMPTCKKELLHE